MWKNFFVNINVQFLIINIINNENTYLEKVNQKYICFYKCSKSKKRKYIYIFFKFVCI